MNTTSHEDHTTHNPTKSSYAYALLCCRLGIEIWKPITKFPDYDVSNMGRLRRRDRWWVRTRGYTKGGYLAVWDVRISCKIHRVVGVTFIPNFENKPMIDHDDRDKHNNRLYNLKWATAEENNANKTKPSYEVHRLMSSRAVLRLDKDTREPIEYFETIRDAALWVFNSGLTTVTEFNRGNNLKTKISAVAQGKRKHAFGFAWEYAADNIEGEIWKDVPPEHINGIKGYKVSSHARIMNHKGRIGAGSTSHHSGRASFQISQVIDGVVASCYVGRHRLVALVFVFNDDPENKTEVDHVDGDKTNDCLEDASGKVRLEWVTPEENVRRRGEMKRKRNAEIYESGSSYPVSGVPSWSKGEDAALRESIASLDQVNSAAQMCYDILKQHGELTVSDIHRYTSESRCTESLRNCMKINENIFAMRKVGDGKNSRLFSLIPGVKRPSSMVPWTKYVIPQILRPRSLVAIQRRASFLKLRIE